ncbi:hypothetical protein [Methylobacterium sp. sgz302541]|uniref:hypothetical protein n=1 Tax=unclassified Methylobacterium TaxID=2615210 RepID=UPI003D34DE95
MNTLRFGARRRDEPDCPADGPLREAGASIAAKNGATETRPLAVLGWRAPKQAALHIRKARQTPQAGGAMHRITILSFRKA